MQETYAVVAAAGSGRRLGSEIPKQYLPLAKKPLLVHSLITLNSHSQVNAIVLVVAPGCEDQGRQLAHKYKINKITAVIIGGKERQESVYRGLLAVPKQGKIVLIHDGARPFLKADLISRMISAARRSGAAVPVIPVKDTIKVTRAGGFVKETLDRSRLVAAQTPQSFLRDVIVKAHQKAAAEGFTGTDDSMLVEKMGLPVELVPGDENNIKITTPADLQLAELMLEEVTSKGR